MLTENSPNLILASTSPFRKALLERLQLNFTTQSPDVDETPLANETPEAYVQRLSIAKAQAVAAKNPNAWVIGSDQCSILKGRIQGKPHTHENAIKQLSESSGERVEFLTGLCLYNSETNEYDVELVPFYVNFRTLSNEEIEAYLLAEEPYNCAGSFKSEGLGISLFKSMQGDDPTALIGLPLITLCNLLRKNEIRIP